MSGFSYHLITDRTMFFTSYSVLAQKANDAGIHYFHLREKDLTPASLLALSKEVRPQLKQTRLIINSSLDVALAIKAEGVHLQKDNLPLAEVRKCFPDLILGYSAHSREDLLLAEESGADFVFLSPVYPSVSKHSFLPAIGLEEASRWIRGIQIPVIALGGLTKEKLSGLQSRGFSGAAGISLFCKEGQFSREALED